MRPVLIGAGVVAAIAGGACTVLTGLLYFKQRWNYGHYAMGQMRQDYPWVLVGVAAGFAVAVGCFAAAVFVRP